MLVKIQLCITSTTIQYWLCDVQGRHDPISNRRHPLFNIARTGPRSRAVRPAKLRTWRSICMDIHVPLLALIRNMYPQSKECGSVLPDQCSRTTLHSSQKHASALPLAQEVVCHALSRRIASTTLAFFKDAIDEALLGAGTWLFGHSKRVSRSLQIQCRSAKFGCWTGQRCVGRTKVESTLWATIELFRGCDSDGCLNSGSRRRGT